MATLTQSQVYTIALLAGLPNPKVMAAIAMAESSGRTDVVNSIGCVGLWQINQPVHVKANPKWTQSYLKNPLNNALAAKKILASQGLRAWEVYTNGMYRKYLDKPVRNEAGATQASAIGDWWDNFKKGFEDGWDVGPGPEDFGDEDGFKDDQLVGDYGLIQVPGLEGVTEGIKKTADLLVNPRTWLRVAYGTTGVLLVVGGLFLIVRNTAVQQTVGKVASAVKKGSS